LVRKKQDTNKAEIKRLVEGYLLLISSFFYSLKPKLTDDILEKNTVYFIHNYCFEQPASSPKINPE